jgi:hypothetical protein
MIMKLTKMAAILAILLACNLTLSAAIPAAQRQALIDLYNSTAGPVWQNHSNWLGAPGTENTWYGVTTDAGNTTVLQIDLGANRLSGVLPTRLGNLVNLQALYLYSNSLRGSIPDTLGNLTSLQALNLSSNAFVGAIPTSLANLVGLSSSLTDISYNALYASDPSLKAFLNSKDPDWAATQTIAPTNISAVPASSTSVLVSWTPITYTGNTGSYDIGLRRDGISYGVCGYTLNKSASSLLVNNLTPGTTYGFEVRTRTIAHSANQNEVASEYAAEVLATPGIPVRKVDFNADGKEDILWRHSGTGQNAVWYLGGNTAMAAALGDSVSQGIAWDVAAMEMNPNSGLMVYRDIAEVGGFLGKSAGTMNFDAQEALAFNAEQGGGDSYLFQAQMAASGGLQYSSPAAGPRKQAQNVLSYAYLPAVTDLNWKLAGTGDFNADGKIDVLWRNSSTGQNAVWFMNGIANTGYAYLLTMADQNWQIVGTGNFDGDGKMDVLWRNSVTGQNAVWFMNGATYLSYNYLLANSDTNWQIVGTGDFNGDGRADILWRHASTGQNAVWFLNGIAYSSYAYLPSVTDTNWRIMGTGDFNGDGKPDIIWRHSTTGQNIVWYMNGITNTGYDYVLAVADILWKIVNR